MKLDPFDVTNNDSPWSDLCTSAPFESSRHKMAYKNTLLVSTKHCVTVKVYTIETKFVTFDKVYNFHIPITFIYLENLFKRFRN